MSESSRIINNILVRQENYLGTAMYVLGEIPSVIKTNCFYGWGKLLEQYTDYFDKTPLLSVNDVAELNFADGDISGDSISINDSIRGNISESPYMIFAITKTQDFHLISTSSCVNSGTDVGESPYNGPHLDNE